MAELAGKLERQVMDRDQEKLFFDNIDLAHKFFHDNKNKVRMEEEDFLQECFRLLWQAVKTYDSKKSQFSTYTYAVMSNGMKMLFGRAKAEKRKVKSILSLDAPVIRREGTSGGEMDEQYSSLLSDDSVNVEEGAASSLYCADILSQAEELMGPEAAQYLKLASLDYKRQEIASIMNIKYSKIYSITRRIKNRSKKVQI